MRHRVKQEIVPSVRRHEQRLRAGTRRSLSRSQETAEDLSRDWAEKSGIWGEEAEGETGWGPPEGGSRRNRVSTADASLSVREFGRGWEGRQLTE